jgi:hypothetical protein
MEVRVIRGTGPPAHLDLAAEAFTGLISISIEEFWSSVWERQPMHVGREPGFLSSILSLKELDRIIEHATSAFADHPEPLRNFEDARLMKRVEVVDGEHWTGSWGKAESRLNLRTVKSGFNHGFSFLLNEVQQRSRSVARLCTAIEDATGFPVNANLYLTPAGGRAFETHFDWMDVRHQTSFTLLPELQTNS